jgi:hypothetical protein
LLVKTFNYYTYLYYFLPAYPIDIMETYTESA